jgi:hypothetical protein
MGIGRLVGSLLEEGRLVAPFAKIVAGSRAYFVIRSSLTGTRPHVQAFVDWLVEAAKTVSIAQGNGRAALSSPPPAAPSAAAARRGRSRP